MSFPEHIRELRAGVFSQSRARLASFLQDGRRFCNPDIQMGAVYSPGETTFRLFNPALRGASVVIASEPEGDAGLTHRRMRYVGKGIWEARVRGDLAGKFYAYKLQGLGHDPDHEITDIYAVCTQGPHRRSLIVDLKSTDPPGFRDNPYQRQASCTEAIAYELHVRDFTIAANSGVTHRGKYLGLAETGTRLNGKSKIATGLDHLKELGVTHVQIMPVHDFFNDESRDDEYDWGYMPLSFMSPEGWYASEVVGPSRIKDLKCAIQAFHQAGIGVIMDVVFNHTAGEAPFEELVPGYYFREDSRGRFSNGSGCGNEFKSEAPMGRKLILDAVKYWVNEYQVDGFRFDLMALIDWTTMRMIREELSKIDPGILVYGEPWLAGPNMVPEPSDKFHVRQSGIGAFNDSFRDAIKGERDDETSGFIQHGSHVHNVLCGLAGITDHWPLGPADTINYFECHDNLTAWDKLIKSVPDASDDDRKRMIRLAHMILLTAQGMPFLHSGQEFCRTKQGNHNSYNAPDEINQIDWSLKEKHADLVEYVKGLIALRKAHPVFHLRTQDDLTPSVSFADTPASKCLAYHLNAEHLEHEPAEAILVLINGEPGEVTFEVPKGKWGMFADGQRAGLRRLKQVTKHAKVGPQSGMILIR